MMSPTPTGRAGPVGHAGDESLLFAGRLAAVTLVLVGVSVGAAHGDVVFVALGRKHNPTVTRVHKTPPFCLETHRLRLIKLIDTYIDTSIIYTLIIYEIK